MDTVSIRTAKDNNLHGRLSQYKNTSISCMKEYFLTLSRKLYLNVVIKGLEGRRQNSASHHRVVNPGIGSCVDELVL